MSLMATTVDGLVQGHPDGAYAALADLFDQLVGPMIAPGPSPYMPHLADSGGPTAPGPGFREPPAPVPRAATVRSAAVQDGTCLVEKGRPLLVIFLCAGEIVSSMAVVLTNKNWASHYHARHNKGTEFGMLT